MLIAILVILAVSIHAKVVEGSNGVYGAINTWPWTQATDAAYEVLATGGNAIDAVQRGCQKCQDDQCDGTVGFGGSPDENGETTLDALVMDGDNFRAGAVGNLRRIKDVIGVARYVMEFTGHTFLAGDQATAFAIQNGFKEENLTTSKSSQMHQEWLAVNCQPNYRANVYPDPTKSCGPYKSNWNPNEFSSSRPENIEYTPKNHDTIAMISLHRNGSMAAGTSTNGARNKIPGRIGDAPIPGAGAYVDSQVGGCGETGDGDLMMRFVPTFYAVMLMKNGLSPGEASLEAIKRIAQFYPNYQGAIVCMNNKGEHGGACNGWSFSYAVRTSSMNATQIVDVIPYSPTK